MLLSLFTPTHNPAYLREAHNSLKLQNLQEWEWIILPNGSNVTIPEDIQRDSRLRVVSGGENLHNVGALKRKACDAASGDAFIEFDHDDMLVPGESLDAIREKFMQGAGFVYSDTAVFRFKQEMGLDGQLKDVHSPYTYSQQHGWESYPIVANGMDLLATRCFDVSPRSLAEIYYSPDHVRSWSRKAYYEAGGHNPELSVCDDHELMIKTYLTGAPFVHTGGCHYLYRMFEHNTVILRNKQIQDITRKLREAHVQGLIQAWIKRTGFSLLDLTDSRQSGWTPDSHLLQRFA